MRWVEDAILRRLLRRDAQSPEGGRWQRARRGKTIMMNTCGAEISSSETLARFFRKLIRRRTGTERLFADPYM